MRAGLSFLHELTTNCLFLFTVNETSKQVSVPTATNRPQYRGVFHALSTIAKTDGVKGLYQGVTPNVWGAGASWGLYFLL